jgi:hypothetical protein
MFWTLAILVSFIFTGLLIFQFIAHAVKNPIVIYIEEKTVHISSINFPAITLCPGLVLARDDFTFLDYDNIVNDIKSQRRSLKNFTEKEFGSNLYSKFIFMIFGYRLKHLQITSLISSDAFMSQFNESIPTDDLVARFDDFVNFFIYDSSKMYQTYPRYIHANWSSYYEVNLTRVLHPKGFCYTFNFPGAREIFQLDKLSSDFNYTESVRVAFTTSLKPFGDHQLKYPVKGPKHHEAGLEAYLAQPKVKYSELVHVLSDVRPKEDRDGFHLIIHDPFEVPSDKSVNIFTLANQTVEYFIKPKIISFDDTFKSYDLEE